MRKDSLADIESLSSSADYALHVAAMPSKKANNTIAVGFLMDESFKSV